MPRLTITEQFDCPPERAFLALTDFPNAPSYIAGIEHTELLTEGPVGLGTRVRETRTLYGRTASEELEITAWDPPRRAVIEAKSHGAHYITAYTVSPKNGGAEVRLDFEARPISLAARLLSVLLRRMFKSVRSLMLKDLADAKAHAQSPDK